MLFKVKFGYCRVAGLRVLLVLSKTITAQIVSTDLFNCPVKQSLQTPQRPRLEPES